MIFYLYFYLFISVFLKKNIIFIFLFIYYVYVFIYLKLCLFARAHMRLILTFAASSVLTCIAVPNSCYMWYFEVRNRRSRRWKEKSSLPTIGSAKRWEVVGIINVTVFGKIVSILFCLVVFSRLGRQCRPRFEFQRHYNKLSFGTVIMKVFFVNLLQTFLHRHRRAGIPPTFSSMVHPWSCTVRQHEKLRPDPASVRITWAYKAN